MFRVVIPLFALAMLVAPAGLALAAPSASTAETPAEYSQAPAAQAGTGRKVAGMWNGTRPARGGAYRWPYLAIGAVVAVLATIALIKYIRYLERMRRRA